MEPAFNELVPLSDPEARDCARAGGKAAALARLVERGLLVPQGVVIPVDSFRAFLTRNGLQDSALRLASEVAPARAEALQATILSAPLPPNLASALRSAGAQLGPLLAVRSSAIDEDGREASFAGMYHTELGVRPGDALERAVRVCWASAFHPRVLAYRQRIGRKDPPAMAVLVQRLVQPVAAGVLFTVNPLTGSWREMTVEAAWGLGEAVVGGLVVPDHYLVRRPRRLPHPVQRLAARIRLDVMDVSVQIQEQRLVVGSGAEGVVWEPVPEAMRHGPKLDRERLLALCRLGLRIESDSGTPQDVEWALDSSGRILILQARPVTSSPRPFREAQVLWTRRFIGERWTEPATPLGWSQIRPLIEWFIAYPKTSERYLGGGEALRLVDGVPFINATVFRHLAFKLPGAPPPRMMMELLPPHEERAWLTRFAAPPGIQVYASILAETIAERRWERFRWNPLTNHKAWEELEVRLQREIPTLSEPPAESLVELLSRVNRGMALARDYVKVHVTSLLFANLLYQLAEGALGMALGAEGEQLARHLLRCPEGNLTVRVNHEMWSLARMARRLDANLDRVPEPGTPFGEAFHGFLRRHGHRSDATWEIMSPRWAERPDRILGLLRSYQEISERDPADRAREETRRGESAMARLRVAIRNPIQRESLAALVELTRKYLLLRENQRYHFDQLLYAVKRGYLGIGDLWVAAGLMDRADDIRFLEADEVAGVIEGHLDPTILRGQAARRAEIYARWLEARPPDFLVGDDPLPPEKETGRRLVGMGASPGVVQGRVRVIRALEEAGRLRPGEILVTRATDPGWTPLFQVAGGIVMEMGSQLSHGAVVAREYRLPAVVNVVDATRILRDGQSVTLDGARGVVWVHA